MSLRAQHPVSTEPATRKALTCADYDPKPGSKQCRSYLPNGGCVRESHVMCEEWLKVNPSAAKILAEQKTTPAHDLFGKPLPTTPPRKKTARKPASPPSPTATTVGANQPPDRNAAVVRYPTEDEIASFRALGIEVCIASEEVGDTWIVPEYTGQDRSELRIDHAATLAAVCAAFPGARVASLEMLTTADAAKQS